VIYVGELPDDVREREVEDLFYDVRNPVSTCALHAGTMTRSYGGFAKLGAPARCCRLSAASANGPPLDVIGPGPHSRTDLGHHHDVWRTHAPLFWSGTRTVCRAV
jgi:hypothetical protein